MIQLRFLALARCLHYIDQGTKELADHKNDGPVVEHILHVAGSERGQPWCAALAYTSIKEAADKYGMDDPLAGVRIKAQVQSHVDFAKARNLVVPFANAAEGDLVAYDFAGNGHYDHLGMLFRPRLVNGVFKAAEGNTNSDGSRDGYEAIVKDRKYTSSIVVINWDRGPLVDAEPDEADYVTLKNYGLVD